MNRFLRTTPTRRLLSTLLGALVILIGATAIAVAATSGGPVASPKALPQAVHDALAADSARAQIQGVSADIRFTNHLIDSADFQGGDPLLSGGSGRLWIGGGKLRLELQSNGGGGDAELVADRHSFWFYDPMLKTIYRGTVPAGMLAGQQEAGHAAEPTVPAVAKIAQVLQRLARRLNISGARAGDTAGQPSYTVSVSPKLHGGLLGSVQLAWDAIRGLPLSVAVYAKNNPTPVLALTATKLTYGPVPAGDFTAAAPAGTKTVQLDLGAGKAGYEHAHGAPATRPRAEPRPITGASAVAAHLPFSLDAPATLTGRSLASVRLVHLAGHPAALVLYGHDLDGLAVLEQAASAHAVKPPTQGSDNSEGGGLTLPTFTLPGGGSATELDTALGTLVHFTRGGVAFTVVGSVTRSVAHAAARGL